MDLTFVLDGVNNIQRTMFIVVSYKWYGMNFELLLPCEYRAFESVVFPDNERARAFRARRRCFLFCDPAAIFTYQTAIKARNGD